MEDSVEVLQRACRSGDTSLLRRCLDSHPSSINALDPRLGWSALYRAVICGHYEASQLLLTSGADPNIRNKVGEVPLHQAADAGQDKLVHLLLDHHADPNVLSCGSDYLDGETPLHKAAKRGHHRVCQLLLTHKADPEMKTALQGQTALHLAVEVGWKRVVQVLVAGDASTEAVDRAGLRPGDLGGREVLQWLEKSPSPDPPYMSDVDAKTSNSDLSPRSTPSSPSGFKISFQPSPPVFCQILHSPPISRDDEDIIMFERSGSAPISHRDQEVTCDFRAVPDSPVAAEDYKRSALYLWLCGVRLDGLFELLVERGYGELDGLLEQVEGKKLNLQALQGLGVGKIGERVRLMACLEEQIVTRQGNFQASPSPFPRLNLCCPQAVDTSTLSLLQWLEDIKLRHLHPNFLATGYSDLEHLLGLMHTKYALTDEVLERDIGIRKLGYRHRILLKLFDDSQVAISMLPTDGRNQRLESPAVLEKERKVPPCELCSIM